MTKISKDFLPLAIVLVVALTNVLSSYYSGYFLDPTFPDSVFLSFWVWFIRIIGSLVVLAILICIPIALLNKDYRTKRKVILAIINLIISVYVIKFAPGAREGITNRLLQYSEEEFQDIANIARSISSPIYSKPEYINQYDDFIQSFITEHEIFEVSSFPIDVGVYEECVYLEWASGFTGGYQIYIFDGKSARHDSRLHPDQFDFFVYEKVAVEFAF
ncbi:hypothetical protein MLD52_21545 [Puniceicoccaceae bacterium K14]|nr:hypothetical protein [Puniceicoccaceae bacterium K14]